MRKTCLGWSLVAGLVLAASARAQYMPPANGNEGYGANPYGSPSYSAALGGLPGAEPLGTPSGTPYGAPGAPGPAAGGPSGMPPGMPYGTPYGMPPGASYGPPCGGSCGMPPGGPPCCGMPGGPCGMPDGGPCGGGCGKAGLCGKKSCGKDDCDLSLPANIPNAFCDPYRFGQGGVYVYLGAMALQRDNLGHSALALRNASADENAVFDPNEPLALSYGDIPQHLMPGIRATVGYRQDEYAIEFTGFYIPQYVTSRDIVIPARLDSFFFNAPNEFVGDLGLWLHADRMNATYRTQLADAELNFRAGSKAFIMPELIFGLRYVDLQERFRLFTDDDGITLGAPDPTLQANYITRTFNRILGPQIGMEGQYRLLRWMAFSYMSKAMAGVNFINADVLLQRGDGLIGLQGKTSTVTMSVVGEFGVFLDMWLMDKISLRLGYETLGIGNVAEAVKHVDYNLANPAGNTHDRGSICYHGPVIELQFSF